MLGFRASGRLADAYGIAVTGTMAITSVLLAVNPAYAFAFMAAYPLKGFLVLGAVFLCVTGGEALYADMGHFGKRAIRIGWFALVMPALLLNYFGQAALVIADP